VAAEATRLTVRFTGRFVPLKGGAPSPPLPVRGAHGAARSNLTSTEVSDDFQTADFLTADYADHADNGGERPEIRVLGVIRG